MFCSDEGACVRFGVAGGSDPLAGGNGCGMANDSHDITMSARLGPKNAEAVLGIVVGDALDEASQHFLARWFCLWLRVDGHIIGFDAGAQPGQALLSVGWSK